MNYYDRKLERIRSRNIGSGFCLWVLDHLEKERDVLRAVDYNVMTRTVEVLNKILIISSEMEDELERDVVYLAEQKNVNIYLAARVRNLEAKLENVTRKADELLTLHRSNFTDWSVPKNENNEQKINARRT